MSQSIKRGFVVCPMARCITAMPAQDRWARVVSHCW
jgi:hypothetical protein